MAHTVTLTGLCRFPGTLSMSGLAIPNASTVVIVNSGAVLLIPRNVSLTTGAIRCLGAKGTTNGMGMVSVEGAGMGSLTIGANASTLGLGAVRVDRIAAGTIASGTATLVSGTAYTLGLGAAAGTGTEGGTGVAVGLATQMPASAPS